MPRNSYYLGSRKLVSQEDAALIPNARVPRSVFQNRFSRLTTFDAGYIYPFFVDEVVPGDHMRYNMQAYIRMSTALFPMFSNQRFDTHWFFVPARILWTNWVKMMGEQANPADTIAYTVPRITIGVADNPAGSLYDHMGIPGVNQLTATLEQVNVLPFRAYNRIWTDWFRDQNIQNSAPIITNDGPELASSGNYVLLRRNKSHDYFTSALPWPQKFTPLQTLFTGTAPIIGIGALQTGPGFVAGGTTMWETDATASTSYPFHASAATANAIWVRGQALGAPGVNNKPLIYADLARATGVTINALRQAWLVQDLLERDARGGTRYTELIRSHFGVINPDFRVQRPEYIGGGQTQINLTPIAQTTPTGGGGLGALGATGTAAGVHSASYAATEHGYILGLLSVRTELHYQQGLHRLWTRQNRYDFYFPALAGLGEQAILRQEIFCNGVDAEDSLVLGYQERWHEYRTRYSDVSGLFRSTATGNIDEWHLAQQFSPAPTLSDAFIRDEPPMSRVLAAGAAAANMQFLADIVIERTATRPIPMFGTPASLARF